MDKDFGEMAPSTVFTPVFQGESKISNDANEAFTTILGSCVATCIWDPFAKIGGVNHFLLPGDSSDRGDNLRYGVNAMELLINGLLKQGAARKNLKAKVLGGAKMIGGESGIGDRNQKFALWFMGNESLEVVSTCVGGSQGRKIRFWPVSGRLQRSFIAPASAERADVTPRKVAERPSFGDVQLF